VGVYTNREYGAFGGHGVSYEIWNAGGIYTDEDGKQQKADSKDLHYWFDKDYQPTYAQCREVFAEFYSAMMMGDEEIIASAERMFPHSVEYMERMAGELLREYKSRHK